MAKQLISGMFSSVPEAQFVMEALDESEITEDAITTSGKEISADGIPDK